LKWKWGGDEQDLFALRLNGEISIASIETESSTFRIVVFFQMQQHAVGHFRKIKRSHKRLMREVNEQWEIVFIQQWSYRNESVVEANLVWDERKLESRF
jgi:hypothetical protein